MLQPAISYHGLHHELVAQAALSDDNRYNDCSIERYVPLTVQRRNLKLPMQTQWHLTSLAPWHGNGF